jgi:hypothetical protein
MKKKLTQSRRVAKTGRTESFFFASLRLGGFA